MPIFDPDEEREYNAEDVLWGRCSTCSHLIHWRPHKGLSGKWAGTCCEYLYELFFERHRKPGYRVKVTEIEDVPGLLRMKRGS